ncbi:MAG: hypothetical protein Q8N96_09785 [Methylovulum sp.]|nr:hypothetical protein [Methylovulum sp.]
MNNIKPLIVSLLLCGGMSSLALADKVQSPATLGFAGVGIGSGQYLGAFLSYPPAPVMPSATNRAELPTQAAAPDCNVDVTVATLGADGMPSVGTPLTQQTLSQGETIFLPVTDTTVDLAPTTAPEYFRVNVKITPATPAPAPATNSPIKPNMACKGVTAALGIYGKVTNDLLVPMPMSPTPQK